MTLKEQGQQMVIDSQDALIRELAKEIRKIKLKNIWMNEHMRILAGIPRSKTAEKIRTSVYGESITDTTLQLN